MNEGKLYDYLKDISYKKRGCFENEHMVRKQTYCHVVMPLMKLFRNYCGSI